MTLYKLTYDILPTAQNPFTNKDVTATLTAWNTEKVYTHVFEQNGEYDFILENPEGKVNAKVTWIDKEILGIITYEYSDDKVVAKLEVEDGATITNNSGSDEYTFYDNGSFTFEVEDEVGNTAKFVAYVNYFDKKNKGYLSMEYYVMKTGFVFYSVKADINNYWKISELFDNKFNVSVNKIDTSGNIQPIDNNNISCVVMNIFDENNQSIDKNTESFLKPGTYTISLALGGQNLFTDVSAKYRVNLTDVSLKGANSINMRLNTNNSNYFIVKVKDLKDLT